MTKYSFNAVLVIQGTNPGGLPPTLEQCLYELGKKGIKCAIPSEIDSTVVIEYEVGPSELS